MQCPSLDELHSQPNVLLGKGGFGSVYKVGDYVVKEIHIQNERERDLFTKEALAWIGVTSYEDLSQNSVPYCYSEFRGSSGFIVQKYIAASSLMDVMRYFRSKGTKVPFNISYPLFYTIPRSYEKLHKAGYIHRDIKPGNILIRDPAVYPMNLVIEPIIIDFGLVCQIPCTERHRVGTRGFYPRNWTLNLEPVMLPHKKSAKVTTTILTPEYTPQSDKYAIGITLAVLFSNTDWTDHEEEKKIAYETIQRLRHAVIPRLAANLAREEGYNRAPFIEATVSGFNSNNLPSAITNKNSFINNIDNNINNINNEQSAIIHVNNLFGIPESQRSYSRKRRQQ